MRIAVSETLALQLERAAQIDPKTEQTVANLVATMRASGPQTDPAWEHRRQASIERLEVLLADWTPAARSHASP